MQKLGQHFLKNKSAIKKIIAALELRDHDTVIEIGAGHGELTHEMQNANSKAHIVAVEKDERLAEDLEKNTNDLHAKNVEVMRGDILALLPSLTARHTSYKLAGNIPYYLTGKLLRTLSELPAFPQRAVLMVQAEVAERMAARPPHMNRLAAIVQFWSSPEIILRLAPSDFSPPPEVSSAVVLLLPHDLSQAHVSRDAYYDMARSLFKQPRKTILNNLKDARAMSTNEAERVLRAAHIEPEARPSTLRVEDIVKICAAFSFRK